MARTTFIVCTHNNRAIIDNCLSAILAQSDDQWDLVVVDDASTDGTVEYITEKYPRARVLRRTQGTGPSTNRNWALAETTSEFVATLDSDVELAADWLERTRKHLESHSDVGIVGGKLLYATNPELINSYGGETGRIGISWDGSDGRPEREMTEAVECLWVCSAAMLARRSVLEEIGGFDETYFYGYEDSDIGWRSVLLGHRCVCIPDAKALHRARTTIGKMGSFITFHYHKNRLRSLLKNLSLARLLGTLPLYIAYSAADGLLRPPRWAKAKAWGWNLRYLRQTLGLRRLIQRNRKCAERDVAQLMSPRWLPPTRLAERAKFRLPPNPEGEKSKSAAVS